MISSDVEIISFENIQLFSQKVTQKISAKYIPKFIQTTLKLNNIEPNIRDKIFIKYIESISTYEIYLIKSTIKYPVPIPFILQLYEQDQNTINLFITKEFYAVYKNNQLYLTNKNNNYTKQDIINFIQYNYKLSIDNIYILNNEQLSQLKKLFIENIQKTMIPQYITFNSDKSYIYFLIYIFVFIVSIFVGYFYMQKQPNNKQELNKQLKILKQKYQNISYKKILDDNIMPKIIELFNYLKIYKITIVRFRYKGKIYLTVVSNLKKNIYDFITVYKKKTEIKKIFYDKKLGKYIMDVEIEL